MKTIKLHTTKDNVIYFRNQLSRVDYALMNTVQNILGDEYQVHNDTVRLKFGEPNEFGHRLTIKVATVKSNSFLYDFAFISNHILDLIDTQTFVKGCASITLQLVDDCPDSFKQYVKSLNKGLINHDNH